MEDTIFIDMWSWNSDEKKWFHDTFDIEPSDMGQLAGLVQEAICDYTNVYIEEITKWRTLQLGTKAQGGRAMLYTGAGQGEDEYDDYDRVIEHKIKFVAIANIDMTKKKFLELRRSLQELVKVGGFNIKEAR